MNSNTFAYMRISTAEESRKQTYTLQEKALSKYSRKHNIEYLSIFREDASGKSFGHRKAWHNLEMCLNSGDTVVVKDISRFSKNSELGYEKYMSFFNKNINLVFIDNPVLCTDYAKTMLHIVKENNLFPEKSVEALIRILIYVELDRIEKEKMSIIRRKKEGLKASEKKAGRPFGGVYKLSPSVENDILKYLTDRSITQASISKKHGLGRNTVKKYIEIVKDRNKND